MSRTIISIAVGIVLSASLFFLFVQHRIVVRVTAADAACINNLRLIDTAEKEWATENQKNNEAIPTWEDMKHYLGRGPSNILPTCPSNGVYSLARVGQHPTCSIPGHVLKD